LLFLATHDAECSAPELAFNLAPLALFVLFVSFVVKKRWEQTATCRRKKFYHEEHEGHEGEFEKTIGPTMAVFDGSSGCSLGGPRLTAFGATLLLLGRALPAIAAGSRLPQVPAHRYFP
jgi:hypothetical protein